MPKWKAWLCHWIMQLDRIPRYGRLYRLPRDPEAGEIKEWHWQRYGRWGMNLLDNLGWFWPYLHHTNPEIWEDDEYDEEGYKECESCSPETPTEPPTT